MSFYAKTETPQERQASLWGFTTFATASLCAVVGNIGLNLKQHLSQDITTFLWIWGGVWSGWIL
jgi:hypothetical protein